MPARASRRIHSRQRTLRNVNAGIFHPPQILVPADRVVAPLHHLACVAALLHPTLGNDLFIAPATVPQIQQAKSRQVASADFKHVASVNRKWTTDVVHIARLVILHADWFCNSLVKSVADFKSSFLLENRAQCVKVPVVVIPECARSMATARWPQLFHRGGLEIY